MTDYHRAAENAETALERVPERVHDSASEIAAAQVWATLALAAAVHELAEKQDRA